MKTTVFCVYVPLCNHFRCGNKQWRRGKRTVFFDVLFPYVFLVWLLLILGFNNGSWPRWKMDMLKKKKVEESLHPWVCVYVRRSKSIDSLSTFGVCESTTGVDSARIHFPYFSPTHTHTLPPFSTSSSTRLFFPFLNRYGTRSSLLLLTGKEGEVVIRGGRGVQEIFLFFFIRESCPNPLTPPLYAKDFFREFHRPKFLFLFLCIIKQKLG